VLAAFMGASHIACGMLPANAVVSQWYVNSPRRGTRLGFVAMGLGLGGIFFGFIMPPVVVAFGFQGVILVLAGVVLAISLVPGLLLIKAPRQPWQE
jgi:MFS family permease